MKFIDLFAGLGGFHLALSKLGHECVFACELEKSLRSHYEKNFSLYPEGDITKIDLRKIPKHDILCAGFPCQPFSKAGFLNGFDHKVAGKMFFYLLKIIKLHKPNYLILENVPNLLTHSNGKTWEYMKKKILKIGYDIDQKILSPIDFKIPQTRDRLYIVAKRGDLKNFKWPKKSKVKPNLKKFLIKKPSKDKNLTELKSKILGVWKTFLSKIPKNAYLPNPLWSMEFGATYPYENQTPYATKTNELRDYKGSFGEKLNLSNKNDIMELLPKYARNKTDKFPSWKINMIRKSRLFYKNNKSWVDKFLPRIIDLKYEAYQKLEWNCQGEKFNLTKKIISFRGSGVRIKRNDNSPTLVSASVSQVPYLPWKNRYLSHEECLNIQGFKGLKSYPSGHEAFYMAIGNAVNVGVVSKIAKNLIN
jgi:DNA (cytosine-5)-methyltransferase 1